MTFRVIDNKRVELSDDEWRMYQDICRSYDKPNFKGKDLFIGLFETDPETGVIIFLRPPSQQFTTFEVFLFLMSVMQHQHIRVMYGRVDSIVQDLTQLKQDLKNEIEQAKKSRA